MIDPYATEAETNALIQRDIRSNAQRNLDAMLDDAGAWEQGAEPFKVLYQIAVRMLEQLAPVDKPHEQDLVAFEAREIGECDWFRIPLTEAKRIGGIIESPYMDYRWIYPRSQARKWVGLTNEEVMVAAYQSGFDIHEDHENEDDPEAMHWWTPDGEVCDDSLLKLHNIIETKLKEKNNG